MQERDLCSQGTNPTAISGFRTKHQNNCTIINVGNGNDFKITKIIFKNIIVCVAFFVSFA